MLTVNSSPPLAKPRVPSSGSTQKKRPPQVWDAARRDGFFAEHRHARARACEPCSMMGSARWSAMVTSEPSLRLRIESRVAHGHDFAAGGEGEGDKIFEGRGDA